MNFQNAALLPIVVPTQILWLVSVGAVGDAQQAFFLGALAAVGSVAALLLQPLAGAMSDLGAGRLGGRHPLIVAGAAASLVGMGMLAAPAGIAAFAVGYVVMQIGSNVCTAAYQGLLPDRAPVEQRGEASGYMGAMTILGNVGSLLVATLLLGAAASGASTWRAATAFYLIAAAALLAGVLVAVLGVPETRPRLVRLGGERIAAAEAFWPGPWEQPAFRWLFAARCGVMLGLALFMTFIEYYFAQVQRTSAFVAETAEVALLALVGAVASALALGALSDRVRRVPIVFVSSLLMAAAATVFVASPRDMPLAPLGIVFGLGYGGFSSVDWALALDTLSSRRLFATHLGLWNIASAAPAALAPLAGGVIVSIAESAGSAATGYRLVFAIAALALAAGALVVLRVDERMLETRPAAV